MSSPITLNGFNNIDFGLVIDAILEQERAPIQNLESAKLLQQAKLSAYGELSSRLSSVESAASALSSAGAFEAFAVSVDDETVASASTSAGASPGTHSLSVTSLAQAQVLASTSLTASADTVIADAGSLDIGGRTYSVTQQTTLAELRDQINADSDGVARASLVDTGSGFKLVLTANSLGTAAAFGVTNSLTLSGAPTSVTFADTDLDGTSGDSAADNAVVAADAALSIDNIAITRSTNSISGAIPGVNLELKSLGSTTISVEADTSDIKGKIEAFVSAYNEFSQFVQDHVSAGTTSALSGDSTIRSAFSELRALVRNSQDTGGAFQNIVEVGLSLDRTGQILIDDVQLEQQLSTNQEDVKKLFQTTLSATDSRVKSVGFSSVTVPGTYSIDVTALASVATTAGATPVNGQINADETLGFTYGATNLNVFLPKNSDITAIVSLINTALSGAGVPITASDNSGTLVLSSNETGSAQSFTVVSDTAALGNGKSTGIGTTPITVFGTDVAGTIDGAAATGSGSVLSGAIGTPVEGLQLQIASGATGSHGTVTLSAGFIFNIESTLGRYLGSSGLVQNIEDRIDGAIDSLDDSIARLEDRLILREQELIVRFTAADQAISQLNAQGSSLSSLFS